MEELKSTRYPLEDSTQEGCFSLYSLCERTVSTRHQLGADFSVPGAGCGSGDAKRLTGLEGTLGDWT